MTFATKLLAAALTTASLLAASLPAYAGLIGATAGSQYYFNGTAYSGVQTFTVDGTVRGSSIGYFDIQVTDTQVIYDYISSATWSTGAGWSSGSLYIENGNLLNFLGAPSITSVTLDAGSNMAGFDASRITFDADSIAVNWAGLNFNGNTRVVLNVNAGALPEPASYALVAVALAGVGLAKRRRKV
ncbi:MAG: PEP-CTERM sorting domain-containing protein [Roseateles sp.]|uniref:PEP-CTERM sorting domain-containing protein n=1 Tax=Roseateles sp. TaxID=1971397 RepID=UPI0040374F5C